MEKNTKCFFDRTVNIRASLLGLMAQAKTESDLEQIQAAMDELKALSPKLAYCTYCSCLNRSKIYRDKEDNAMCYDCDLYIK